MNRIDSAAWLGRAALLLLLGVGACRQAAAPSAPRLTATPAVAVTGQPVTFSWTGGDAETCTLATGVRVLEPGCRSGRATETYAAAGSYPVVLELSAGGVTRTGETTVTVTADPVDDPIDDPTDETPDAPTFTARADPDDGLSVTFTVADAPTDAGYVWRFGDGNRGAGAQVTHRYARAGTYKVTLEVTNAAGTHEAWQTLEVGSEAANERVILFDGDDFSAWRLRRGGAPNWRIGDGFAEVVSGDRVAQNDLQTRDAFGDFRLHLEFRVPETAAELPEQARGNSGVYLQGRYEVQILDSFGRALSGKNDAGALYNVADASVNASRPAGSWQTYEILFRAARFESGKKTDDARVTVFWNGQKVQDEVRLRGPTRLGAPERGGDSVLDGVLTGPILLQDHGNPVQYRNIWLERL